MSMLTKQIEAVLESQIEMTPATFDDIRQLVYNNSGISLGVNKQALVRARIQKRMRALGIDSYSDYVEHVKADRNGTELQELLEAISTNVTSFYRESGHFEFMRTAIDEMLESGSRKLRIWSSACSTGEEVYTTAIEVLETLGNRKMDVKILATDIATKVLRKCHQGEYKDSQVAPVPTLLRNQYFTRIAGQEGFMYSVNKELRRMVYLRQFNLTNFPFDVSGPMDFIFCRNVMIYFDRPTRAKIVNEFSRILRPGGILFMGHSESLTGMSEGFTAVKPSIYRKG
jgi:chemotaxis protein methyltransferase CheR